MHVEPVEGVGAVYAGKDNIENAEYNSNCMAKLEESVLGSLRLLLYIDRRLQLSIWRRYTRWLFSVRKSME